MKWFILAALAGLTFWTPDTEWIVCGFRWLTGLECPLCGMTRALHALLKGRAGEALAFHVLSPLVLAIILAHLGPRSLWSRTPWVAIGALFAVFGVGRHVIG